MPLKYVLVILIISICIAIIIHKKTILYTFKNMTSSKINATVLCHFYNEEYLLPFWLKHHCSIFTHGIMIDYHSTDKSVEIIKELCPTWEIRKTKNEMFDAHLVDKEVMEIEDTLIGFKIALNVTEFIIVKNKPIKLAIIAILTPPINKPIPSFNFKSIALVSLIIAPISGILKSPMIIPIIVPIKPK